MCPELYRHFFYAFLRCAIYWTPKESKTELWPQWEFYQESNPGYIFIIGFSPGGHIMTTSNLGQIYVDLGYEESWDICERYTGAMNAIIDRNAIITFFLISISPGG